MTNITSTLELRNAILLLEAEQAAKEVLLKEQFYLTYESLKPANLLRSTITNALTSPFLIDTVISNVVGLATGYLSKKILMMAPGGIVTKIVGSILQAGVSKVVSQNPEAIKSVAQFAQHIFHNKEVKP